MRRSVAWGLVATLAVAEMLSGCHAESTKQGDGGRLKVSSPLGDLQVKVKTDDDAAETGTGVPIYPGATLLRKGKDKNSDNGTADINLSFGSMRLRVEVLSYETPDAPDQVKTFYARELRRFGAVITCVDERAVGSPVKTPEGLTCDKDKDSGGVQANAGNGEAPGFELKAGSPQHQHAVTVEPSDRGTKFALIRIDLPKRFTIGDAKDSGDSTQ